MSCNKIYLRNFARFGNPSEIRRSRIRPTRTRRPARVVTFPKPATTRITIAFLIFKGEQRSLESQRTRSIRLENRAGSMDRHRPDPSHIMQSVAAFWGIEGALDSGGTESICRRLAMRHSLRHSLARGLDCVCTERAIVSARWSPWHSWIATAMGRKGNTRIRHRRRRS